MRIYRILKMVLGSVLLVNAAFAADADGGATTSYKAPVKADIMQCAPIAPEELTYGVLINELLVLDKPTIRAHNVYGLDFETPVSGDCRSILGGKFEILTGYNYKILEHCRGLTPYVPFKKWIHLTEEDKTFLPFLPHAIKLDEDCFVQLAYFFPSALGLSRDPVALIIHCNKACGKPSSAQFTTLGSDGLRSYEKELDRLNDRFKNMISVVNRSAPIEELEFYAKNGCEWAQFNLGAYYNSTGVAMDPDQAVTWFRRAADQGHVGAQVNLGVSYYDGTGVAMDPDQAVTWFRRAAEAGNKEAQYYLGICYANGTGVAMDSDQAVAWFRRAADQGHVGAQVNLGVSYYDGTGVAKDPVQAAVWFRRAADKGYASAQYNLGMMYKEGEGVGQDYNLALEWLRKAFGNGVSEAKDAIEIVVQALKAPAV